MDCLYQTEQDPVDKPHCILRISLGDISIPSLILHPNIPDIHHSH